MPCYHPITGYYSKTLTKNGKRAIVFNIHDGYADQMVSVPCGKCIGCRLERSKMWAVRCVHEASLYDDNCFITLTIDNGLVFNDVVNDEPNRAWTLVKRDFVLFMKRLRKTITPRKVRFFHCGEYGSLMQRPHHHACLFGFDFPDKKVWSIRDGVLLYRSALLEKLWPYGYSTIGDVTFESAAYVARYVTKKITGEKAEEHYQGRVPEYITMSRRPGLGQGWLDKFADDIYNYDELVIRGGKIVKVPKFYDEKYNIQNPEIMVKLKRERIKKQKNNPDNHWRRLQVREVVQKKNLDLLKRGVENG